MVTSATLRNPPWMDGITFAGQDARLATVAALLASAGSSGSTGVAARAGVRPALGFALQVSASSGMNISVAAGIAMVQGSSSLDAGIYPVVLDTATTLTVTAADPSNPRIDNVCLTLNDVGSSSSTFVVQIQAGTPASSPVAPTLPANSLLLATIQVNADASSITSGNITDQRSFTVGLGGILLCQSSAQYPTSGGEEQYLHDKSTGRLRRSDGAGGVVPVKTAPFAAVMSPVTTTVTCTTSDTPITSVTFTCDGSTEVRIIARYGFVAMATADANAVLNHHLYLDGSPSTFDAWDTLQTTVGSGKAYGGHTNISYLTPAAGTHTIAWKAQVSLSSQPMQVSGSANFPAYLRVEPVSP